MAKYTMELRDVIDIKGVIFNFNYEFYGTDEQRQKFEEKFLRHFYFHEIGFETIDRFLFALQDKFLTVFPYYNKLLETASIDYEILDNYKLTETITTTRETEGKISGVSSSVDQNFDNQETTTENSGSEKFSDTQDVTLEEYFDSRETTDVTHDGDTSKTITDKTEQSSLLEATIEATGDITEKFLDTPQGNIDIDDNGYITNLKNNYSDKYDRNLTTNDEETSVERTETFTDDTQDIKSVEKIDATDSTTTTETEGTKEHEDSSNVHYTGEQKSTHDNNTRTHSNDTYNEKVELVRKGNIGVDTDSDVIQKHIKLQKTLTSIEIMFFAECEDLFMQVF